MRDDERALTPVMGVLMLMPMLVIGALSFWMFMDAWSKNMNAQRDQAQKAAWCARNPNQEWPGEGECPTAGPRGYECETLPNGHLYCQSRDAETNVTREADNSTTFTLVPTTTQETTIT